MMRMVPLHFSLTFLILLYVCSSSSTSVSSELSDGIPGIIFDSDMGPDYDDVGAITVLHALAEKGECKILATMASNRYPYTAPTIEVFNRFFGHKEIPIGVPKLNGPNISCPNHWTDSITKKYLPVLKTNEDYPDAVSVYRKVLAKQPDKSVVIVTVGFLTNLEGLLKSGADSTSVKLIWL